MTFATVLTSVALAVIFFCNLVYESNAVVFTCIISFYKLFHVLRAVLNT